MQLGLCFTSRYRDAATALAARLERNLGAGALLVESDEEPVSSIWEQATSASAVLLILDAISAPPGPVHREDWESLLEHNGAPPMAVWRADPCHYPKLLERRPFLSTGDALEAARWVERWLVAQQPSHRGALSLARAADAFPESWWEELVDRPGRLAFAGASALAAAHSFAFQADTHFQGVLWIPAMGRPWETVVAEAEHRAGSAERLLIVLAGWDGEIPAVPEGRHSWLAVAAPLPAGVCQPGGFPLSLARRLDLDVTSAVPLDAAGFWLRARGQGIAPPDEAERARHRAALAETFRPWRVRMDECEVLAAFDDSAEGLELGWNYARFLAERLRTREAVYWFREVIARAPAHGNTELAREAQRELSWLVDETGAVLRNPAAVGEQLSLFGF
ncbi:MAG: hypothetical protein FJW31_09830 [Acidobacteria bacterium]|nr:hypothetical protein [Acidobacteriota bacterium]